MTTYYLLFSIFLANTAQAEEGETIKKLPDKSIREKEIESLGKISITATHYDKSILEYTSPATVLTQDELKLKSDLTIGETLSKEPGVSSSYNGPGSSRPIIRSFAGDRIRILRNGVGTLDISNTSEDHQISINPMSVNSIEVLRGPETLLYGSSAIGGVVNVTDGSIPSKEIGKPLKGEFDLRTQTANDEKTGALKLEGQSGKFNWHLSGLSQNTNDVDIPSFQESSRIRALEAEAGETHEQKRDTLTNSDTRTISGTAGGSYVWDKGFFGLALTGYDTKYGIPFHGHHAHDDHDHGHDHDNSHEHNSEHSSKHNDNDDENIYIKLKQYRVDARGEIRDLSNTIEKIKFSAAGSTYEHREFENELMATKFTNDAFEARTEIFHAPINSLSGIVGSQLEYSNFTSNGREAYVPNSRRFAPGVFTFEELPLIDDTLAAQFGGRVEYVHLDPAFEYRSRDFVPLSLSSGLSWDITQDSSYVAGVSLAYSERAPSASELYSNGVHVARSISESGDESLDKENSFGIDLTFKKNRGVVTSGVSLFAQHFENYINLTPSGRERSGVADYSYNETRAQLYGFEFETTLHAHEIFGWYAHAVDFTAQVDYVRGRDVKHNNDLPRITPFRTILRAEYGWKELFKAGIEGVFVAAQRDIADGELPTDAYQLLNTSLETSIPYLKERNMSLYALGRNLTNEDARLHTSFIKDYVPLPGRSFILGLKGTF